jgi:transposase
MDITLHLFRQEEIHALRQYRDKQRDARLKIRFLGLLLLADQLPLEQVATLIGKSVKRLKTWGPQYLTKGIDSLNSFNYQPKQTYLTPSQGEQLVAWVTETAPAKTKHVRAYIQEHFTVSDTVEAVRQVLHKHGLKRLRPTKVPGTPPSEEAQGAFVAQYEALKAASVPGTMFAFGDAMHWVHQHAPGYCWGDPKDPPIIKTHSGRKRLNILGAYTPADHSFVHVTGEENCHAERVVVWLETVEKAYLSAPKIVLFVDNARYFKATLVEDWLQGHPRLQLASLPVYAPNLNLIERFWNFVKEHLVKNTYSEPYKTFRAHVFRFLNHVEDYVDELKSLMVEKFEIIRVKTA